jgi:drug/metabolite transporter (DMT)-like permease
LKRMTSNRVTSNRMTSFANLAGFAAILLWGLLALFTASTADIPPFQLAAMTFGIAGTLGFLIAAIRQKLRTLMQPWPIMLIGIGGLFGYHACYFAALKNAPPAEASLIAYLWPLLIVLFTALLPGETLRGKHVLGALLGLLGVVALAMGRPEGLAFSSTHLFGYALALCCAFIWSGYSVLTRLYGEAPTDAVTGFCLITALLSGAAHGLLETTIMPADASVWLAVLGLALGPVGAAFFLWDHGMKKGDIRLLGVASFATPPISTLALLLAGKAQPSLALGLSSLLIMAGALIASRKG